MLLRKEAATLPMVAECSDREYVTSDGSSLGTTVRDFGCPLCASLDLSRAALLLPTILAACDTVWRPVLPLDRPVLKATNCTPNARLCSAIELRVVGALERSILLGSFRIASPTRVRTPSRSVRPCPCSEALSREDASRGLQTGRA